jgi:hypothetical protein
MGWREVVSRRHLKLSVLAGRASTMTCRRRGGEEGRGTEAMAAAKGQVAVVVTACGRGEED